eukprot:TRINITY_DN42213_c0_g1_i1.p1 TRINITY_DN42213_c0_g1~~TRINITY_DN42213_c0_g1_i1.p1  ORF type:complete len:473 (-),score=50.60 TRINITY_DN42213_c0_g1_i1:13-1431(-)
MPRGLIELLCVLSTRANQNDGECDHSWPYSQGEYSKDVYFSDTVDEKRCSLDEFATINDPRFIWAVNDCMGYATSGILGTFMGLNRWWPMPPYFRECIIAKTKQDPHLNALSLNCAKCFDIWAGGIFNTFCADACHAEGWCSQACNDCNAQAELHISAQPYKNLARCVSGARNQGVAWFGRGSYRDQANITHTVFWQHNTTPPIAYRHERGVGKPDYRFVRIYPPSMEAEVQAQFQRQPEMTISTSRRLVSFQQVAFPKELIISQDQMHYKTPSCTDQDTGYSFDLNGIKFQQFRISLRPDYEGVVVCQTPDDDEDIKKYRRWGLLPRLRHDLYGYCEDCAEPPVAIGSCNTGGPFARPSNLPKGAPEHILEDCGMIGESGMIMIVTLCLALACAACHIFSSDPLPCMCAAVIPALAFILFGIVSDSYKWYLFAVLSVLLAPCRFAMQRRQKDSVRRLEADTEQNTIELPAR